jgi:acetyl-CoA carboxylase biotin carboxyl carrier protein
VSDEATGPTAGAGEGSRGGLDAVTDEVLPALIARLRSSRLGELEVRTADWRVRLRRDASAPRSRGATAGLAASSADDAAESGGTVARSPAVGYFSPARGLVVGLSVQAGDMLGDIDVLGISQEVVAPGSGIVSAVLAEEGQAVEYGQALIDIDPLELDLATEITTDEADASEADASER